MIQLYFSVLRITVLAILAAPANAELIDRGGGLIYDSDQDLTWTQDAGMSGSVSWNAAKSWVESQGFGGVTGWRLPITIQGNDPTCSGDVRAAGENFTLFYEHRLDCLGGEMERLTAAADPWNNPLFFNVNRTRYWTATSYRDGIDPCIYYPVGGYEVPCTLSGDNGDRQGFYWQWGFAHFDSYNGPAFKTTLEKGNKRFAWPVHGGNVRQQGDINFDDQVNVADYLLLMQFVLGILPAPLAAAPELNVGDMNLNEQLDAGDLVLLSRTIMGLI